MGVLDNHDLALPLLEELKNQKQRNQILRPFLRLSGTQKRKFQKLPLFQKSTPSY